MNDKELMQQTLETLEWHLEKGAWGADIEGVTAALRERLAQKEQEPVAWRNAALRVGEDLCSVNPFGYYDMTAQQWLDWALSVVTVHNPQPEQQHEAWCASLTQLLLINPPKPAPCNCKTKLNEPQPLQWQGLTDEERNNLWRNIVGWGDPSHDDEDLMKAIEAKLREKNA